MTVKNSRFSFVTDGGIADMDVETRQVPEPADELAGWINHLWRDLMIRD